MGERSSNRHGLLAGLRAAAACGFALAHSYDGRRSAALAHSYDGRRSAGFPIVGEGLFWIAHGVDCGMKTAERRLRNEDCGTKIAEWRLRNEDCGMKIAERRLRNGDCGTKIAERRLRNEDCGTKIAERRLRNEDCGTKIAERRLRNEDCEAASGPAARGGVSRATLSVRWGRVPQIASREPHRPPCVIRLDPPPRVGL